MSPRCKQREAIFLLIIFLDWLCHLHGLEAAHPAAAAAPHEAEPLDPVIRGHGGVPHTARPYLHATSHSDTET